jgi:Peptidase family M23.
LFVVLRKKTVLRCAAAGLTLILAAFYTAGFLTGPVSLYAVNNETEKKYIKWVDFTVPYTVLKETLKLDIKSYGQEVRLNWIELLAYLAAKYGGNFKRYKKSDLDAVVKKLNEGMTMEEIAKGMKYYDYYLEAYTAVLGGFVGEYEIEVDDPDNPGRKKFVKKYGLKAFSPIAKGYSYTHYDDFGDSRTYGFKRKHLGNDLLGAVGTPIIAVETGKIEVMGWNRYGGWRIGIRSLDGKRYYYYAHLRKNHPFNNSLAEGDIVTAGDVIGYMGMTGYSTKENVNNIKTPHLHFGMQLIFDESQKDGINQIWIDTYHIVKLLEMNKSAVWRDPERNDYFRVYRMIDPVIPD